MAILWTDDLSVKVKEIDAQHQTLLELLNSLYEVTRRIGTEEELAGILRQLEGYATFHFATEEKYFDKFDYSEAEEHKQEHRELLRNISRFKSRYPEEDIGLLPEIAEFVEGWLREHWEEQDKRYARCFNSNGLF